MHSKRIEYFLIECIFYCIPEARKRVRKDFQGLNPAKEVIAEIFWRQYRYGNPEKYSTGIVISNTSKVRLQVW